MPIKVLHIIPQIGTGGAEIQLCKLIYNSDQKAVSHQVLYYAQGLDDKVYKIFDEAGIDYSYIPRNKKYPLSFIKGFALEIRKRSPDIVHCWLWSGNIWGRFAAIVANSKNIIVSYRNCELGYAKILWFFERLTGHKVHYLANSKAVAKTVGKYLGVASDKFDVIYNGLNIDNFKLECDKKEFKKLLGIPQDCSVISMLGRLTHQKNYPMFLETARLAKEANIKVHFLAVGYGPDETKLMNMASDLGVSDMVHFLGVRTDVPEILGSSDIFYFTTLFEGFPNALMEAMASRLPIVTTDFDGLEELFEDKKHGLVVPVDDPKAGLDAIEILLQNPSLAEQFGKNAYMRIAADYSIEKLASNYLNYYRELLK